MKQKKLLTLSLSLLLITETFAMPLNEVLEHTLHSNSEIKSLRSNTEAYKFYVDEHFGNYLPTLSVDAYLEDKDSTNKNLNTKVETDKDQNGYNAIIKVEQMIYDGGLTPAKVSEAKHNYEANKIKNISVIEEIMYETIKAYLESVKYMELELLTKHNVLVHEGYLDTAKESEEISGETLDRLQVESKLLNSQSQYVKEKREALQSYAKLSKLTGLDVSSNICRPVLDNKNIKTVDEVVEDALVNNYTILEELQNIEAQRSVISQEQSKFLPTLKARFSREYDKDIDAQDVYKEENSARISLTYNLFNGLKDKATYLREKKFLKESQERLDDIVNAVKEDITSEKATYDSSLKRIVYLKTYIENSKNILIITKEQFEGGTKTFLDVLNSEADLYRARKDLIDEEYVNLLAYYQVLNLSAKLSETVFKSEKQECKKISVDLTLPKYEDKEEVTEILTLPIEKRVVKAKKIDEVSDKKEISNIYKSLIDDIYADNDVKAYDKKLELQKTKNKELQNEKARLVKQDEEQLRLAKIKAEKLEKARLASKEADRLAKQQEAQRVAKLEAEKLEKERLASKEADRLAKQQEAQRVAKLEAEKLEQIKLEKIESEKEEVRIATIKAEKLEQARLMQLKADKLAKQKEEARVAKLEKEAMLKEQELLAREEMEKKILADKEALKIIEKREVAKRFAQIAERERLAQLEEERLEREEKTKKNDEIKEVKFASSDSKEIIDNSIIRTLQDVFKEEKPVGYTITVSTFEANQDELDWFIKRYTLNKDVISYKILKDGKEYIKVINGVFDSVQEAKKAIESLHPYLQKNKPYVESISSHKNNFDKFNK